MLTRARSAVRARPPRQSRMLGRALARSSGAGSGVRRAAACRPADAWRRRCRGRSAARRPRGSSFYCRHAHPAARAARGDVRDLRLLPRGRRHRRRWRRRAGRRAAARALAARHRRALCRQAPAQLARPRAGRSRRVRPAARGFPGRHRRHGDGRRRRHPRARSGHARPLLRPRRERGRPAVGAGLRHGGRRRASTLAHHLGRALQLTNILRDLDEDAGIGRLYLPREAAGRGRHRRPPIRRRSLAASAPGRRPARSWSPRARASISRRPTPIMAAAPRAHGARAAASWRRPTARSSTRMTARGWAPPRQRVQIGKRAAALDRCCARAASDDRGTVHVIGAGLAGLCRRRARSRERGARVVLHEAAPQAGGRCRSYFDAALDMTIDNGNHLCCPATMRRSPISRDRRERPLIGPDAADFDFVDLATGERWTLRPNDGRLPWWIFDASAPRARHAACATISALARLLCAAAEQADRRRDATARARSTSGCVRAAAARGAQHRAAGRLGARSPARCCARRWPPAARACRPLIAARGLSARLRRSRRCAYLQSAGRRGPVRRTAAAHRPSTSDRVSGARLRRRRRRARRRTSRRPRRAARVAARAAAGSHGADRIPRHRQRAFPHRRRRAGCRPMTGVVNGTAEWLFAFPAACRSPSAPPTGCSTRRARSWRAQIWREVAAVAGLPAEPLPPWQIVQERRATFAARRSRTPAAGRANRAGAISSSPATGPRPACRATIEGAIRSGQHGRRLCCWTHRGR